MLSAGLLVNIPSGALRCPKPWKCKQQPPQTPSPPRPTSFPFQPCSTRRHPCSVTAALSTVQLPARLALELTQRTLPEVSSGVSTPTWLPPAPRPPVCQPRHAHPCRHRGPLGWRCPCARVCLRSCRCITKPMLDVLVWPGVARQRFSVTCFRAPGNCPGASLLVVCALD